MSYTDLDPDYYRERTEQCTELEMQFADPDWQPDPRKSLRLDLSTPEGRIDASKLLFGMNDFVIVKHLPEPDIDDNSHWVGVPFRVAWMFYALLTFFADFLMFGAFVSITHFGLGYYVAWGIGLLLSLPVVSYVWARYARYRHYK